MRLSRLLAVAAALAVPGIVKAQDGVDRYVRASDGVQLRYVIIGSGRDTVIVPLAAWLEKDLAPLAAGRVLVLYDPRGRGGSTHPTDTTAYGWRADVADLESIRKHLRHERVSLLGVSYFGAVAALYASQFPTRVKRLVMVGPLRAFHGVRLRYSPTARQKPDTTTLRALDEMRRAGLDAADPAGFCRADLFARLVPGLMGDPDLAVRMQDDPCAFSNEYPARVAATWRYLSAANGEWDWRSAAARVTAPTLIVHGADDPISPMAAGRDWGRRLHNARLLGIVGAGHSPWLDGQPLFFEAVNEFLNGGWPAGSEIVRVTNPR